MMKVENMTSASGNKVANQFIITNGNTTTFQSYDSTICEIVKAENGKSLLGFDLLVRFGRDWDYSRTTSKYLHQFLSENRIMGLDTKKDIEDAIERGYIRTNECVAVMYDETM